MKKTTIQIRIDTLEKLKKLKQLEKQSYDEVINSLINNIEEETLTKEEIEEIQQALEDIKKQRVYDIESVAKELKIKL